MDRRKFFLTMLATATGAFAEDSRFWQRNRYLALYRPASKEKRTICFFKNGRYDTEAYKGICWLLRDVKDGNAMTTINISLINLLYAQQQYLRQAGRSNPLIVIHSGYRTLRHNNSLENAARNSRHLSGNAVDFHMEQTSISELIHIARHFKVGGIGAYGTFVHNDIGRYREWRG